MKRTKRKKTLSTTGTLGLSRRNFLRNLTLLGAGAAAYSSPKVKAAAKMLSKAQTLGGTGVFIDVQLPANYNIEVPSNPLTIRLASGQRTNVDFRLKGIVVLNKTATAGIAEVKVNSLRLDSNQPEPLAPVGLQTGPIVAEVPAGSVVGMLNLKTGELVENEIPLKISLPKYSAGNAGKNPQQTKIVQKSVAQARDKCFIRDVNVDFNLPKTPNPKSDPKQSTDLVPPTTTTGTLNLGFIPVK